MRRILVAFLGAGPYDETTYKIEGKPYKSQLAYIPIYEHFSPVETVYIIGTKDSKWEMLREFPYRQVEIPYGKSEDDFWKMFNILSKELNLKDSEVIFDITHCFRTIPIFTVIYIRFLKYAEPTANFSRIFYGIYERGQLETPIIDLAPLLELLDWIDAATSFISYGEVDGLAEKIKTANDKIWRSDVKERPKMLGEFSKRLESISNLSRLTYVPLLSGMSKEMSEFLNREELKSEIKDYVRPFSLLYDSLVRYTSRFAKPSIWESHLEASKYYLENKRPTQSLLVLRETILTALCEKEGCDPYDRKVREMRENELNEQRRKSDDSLIKLWQRITDARNRAGHALMNRAAEDLSPTKAIKEVEELIKETEIVLGGLSGRD